MAHTFLILPFLLLVVSLSSPHPQHHTPTNHQQNLSDVISALLSTTDFQTWASLLLSSLPLNASATIFVPSDAALSHLPTSFDPFLIPYHVVPNLSLSSSSLLRLPPLSLLPTLLPRHSLLLSHTSLSNISVDASPLSRPDLFLSPSFAAHGIRNVLSYSLHRDSPNFNTTADAAGVFLSPPPREVEVGSVWVSGASAGADGFAIVFFFVFFFGILRIEHLDP